MTEFSQRPACKDSGLDRTDKRQSILEIMTTRFSKLVRCLCLLCLAVWAVAPRASAQTRPGLGLQFSGGPSTLSITGDTGTVYSIQYATNLSSTSPWTYRTLFQVRGTNDVWTDPSAPTPSQRFYRAVSVPAPTDTNLVFIQPGTFTMGSPANEVDRDSDEGPQTQVNLTRGFWMGKYEVTQAEYQAIIGSNPSWFNDDLNRPVESVSWYDAANYCFKLSASERAAGRLPSGYVYRLPTEAEWEYAARAGTTTRFSFGDDLGYLNLENYAWYADNSGNTTHPVGQKLANAWGLHDMYGNVRESCLDWYGKYPGGSVTDPKGTSSGSGRVSRGGRWLGLARYCRSADRYGDDPAIWSEDFGFRVVLAPGLP